MTESSVPKGKEHCLFIRTLSSLGINASSLNLKVSTQEGTSRRDLLQRLVPCVCTIGLVVGTRPLKNEQNSLKREGEKWSGLQQ